MSKLSPAAQAVLDAYINAPCGKPRRTWVAAALRAAAHELALPVRRGLVRVDDLLAIAAELENLSE